MLKNLRFRLTGVLYGQEESVDDFDCFRNQMSLYWLFCERALAKHDRGLRKGLRCLCKSAVASLQKRYNALVKTSQ
ncbi:MAG: hypothetical protein LBS04_01195 [Tannerellaceae bacterium]|nr:hypothetical protein [Tannerellaceae bacterium]